jgi:chorismate dehydratase
MSTPTHPIESVSLKPEQVLKADSKPIRLGAISFINTVPIYFDFRSDLPLELVYEVPAKLNAMMAAGELDVSPVSSAFYLRHQAELELLKDVSVSSPGAVESVLFVSNRPWGSDLLAFDEIRVPDDSETSVALLAHLLKEATGHDLSDRFVLYDAQQASATLQHSGNALIIGDNALLTAAKLPVGFQGYDLSSLWQRATALPFVFAVWVANKRWATQNPEALQDLNEALCQSRDRFYENPMVFQAGVLLAQQRSGLPEETLRRYYQRCLSYGLDAAHLAALERFNRVLSPVTIADVVAQPAFASVS